MTNTFGHFNQLFCMGIITSTIQFESDIHFSFIAAT